MDAALRFGGRHALHAVRAAFPFQLAVHLLAIHRGDDFLEAAGFGRVGAQHLDPPALRFGVAAVHAKQVAGEQRRLIAAGAGPYFHNDAAVVVRVARQQQEAQIFFQRFQVGFQGANFVADGGSEVALGVLAGQQFLVLLQVPLGGLIGLVGGHDGP